MTIGGGFRGTAPCNSSFEGTEPTADEWREHASACLLDAVNADVLLLYAAEDERHFGSLLEAKWVYLVAPHDWPFLRNHPLVRVFTTLEAAVEALVAQQAGERERRHAA
jgi:hypothetical protein